MSITVYTYNDKVLKNVATDKWLQKKPSLPPIAANTVRVRTSDGNVPNNGYYETATLVTGTTDVYDCYSELLSALLIDATNVVEILGANLGNQTSLQSFCAGCTSLTTIALFDTSNITDISYAFYNCTSLTTIPLFNTINVTNVNSMLRNCSSLTNVPLFNTSSVTNTMYMFEGCTNVESGALALYQQMSTQATPPSSHERTFRNCGSNTTTGAAELAQIPSDWK